jgi:hypothetical protein
MVGAQVPSSTGLSPSKAINATVSAWVEPAPWIEMG